MENRNVIILKTDIQSEHMLRLVSPLFDSHKAIVKWSVDLEDCDKVLRIESSDKLCKNELMSLLNKKLVNVEELKD